MTGTVFVAGHTGMVGSAICRALEHCRIKPITRSRQELDLRDGEAVRKFLYRHRVAYVFLAAAKVGGIHANSVHPADFIYDNLQIQNSLIHGSCLTGVKKLLFLGSACIYPKNPPQPIKEETLLSGPLEPTNEAYAVAKIAGIKMCQAYWKQHDCDFISVMPCNLYGPDDTYNRLNSHVIPAMILKFHVAKKDKEPRVLCWGTGKPMREFLHVDDLARACIMLMEEYSSIDIINIGSGQEISMLDLARTVKRIVGYEGTIVWDRTRPDGVARRLLDCSKLLSMGWSPRIGLEAGIAGAYEDFLKNP